MRVEKILLLIKTELIECPVVGICNVAIETIKLASDPLLLITAE